ALRESLAGYLARTRGVLADPDDVVVTAGYVQALSLAATVLGGGPVAMEDPGLPFHRSVVSRAGRTVVPLPVDADGARPADLVATRADLAVVTPAHQYPTGVPLAPARRRELLAWADDRHVVLEDDYDGEFRYDRQPVGALQGGAPDRVVYVGSAAKTLAPGLRLAWMVLPRRLRDDVVDAKLHSTHATEALGQLSLAELIDSHAYDRHVRATRLRYRRRSDQLAALLERRAGRNARARAPRSIPAGLQVVVRVPDEDEVLARAERAGVGLTGLRQHHHGPGGRGAEHGVVVGFARPRDAAYPRALAALGRVLP
ncbi:MAG: PLP-dependent aminotransferase family protein, partial [Nocardioidaceae bacterium]|nr:PLP-dependent aminotransferase family protein [Nocardioidaceae bacterium]